MRRMAGAVRLVGDASPCDQCGRHLPDLYAVLTPEGEHGFCAAACMSVWVRTTFIECARWADG